MTRNKRSNKNGPHHRYRGEKRDGTSVSGVMVGSGPVQDIKISIGSVSDSEGKEGLDVNETFLKSS